MSEPHTAVRTPRLVTTRATRRPKGVVLVLHGGGDLAVFRLLNSHRGWDSALTPVMDVTWALGQVRETYGDDVPICLVGHSLGGRAALLSGGEAGVRGVVALNPWVYPHDHADLRGRRVLIVHGTDDRVAPLRNAAAVAERLSSTTSVELVTVDGGKHAMLRHAREFERPTSDFVVDTLLGR